ncbi:MAG TPA: hypothetical protein VII05_04755, partial [Gaiellaceae bacterium]
KAIIGHLLGRADLSRTELASLQKHETVAELVAALEVKQPRNERQNALLAEFKRVFPQNRPDTAAFVFDRLKQVQ